MIKTLYLLRHKGINEYTKIGYTADLDKRIKSLQTASPTGIEIIYSINTKYAKKLEQHLHSKYARKNSNLEWFKLTREDLVDIMFYIEDTINRYEK